MKCKEAIFSNGSGGVLCTLEDGRCCVAYIKNDSLVIEILLDSFLKWQAFDEVPTEKEIKKAEYVIETTDKIYESALAKAYLSDVEVKETFDKIKKRSRI